MNMPQRLTVVGDLERRDHHHLTADHRCYFWGEYTPYEHTNGRGWNFSTTNQLVSNLKKKMDRVGQSDWRHKQAAIESVGKAFAGMWKWQEMNAHFRPALIPMPPSKARIDPMYDPRMFQILNRITAHAGVPLDIRDCLSFDGSLPASHEANHRPTPEMLAAALTFDPAAGRANNPPSLILLFDDMLTTGAHFIVAVDKLNQAFPGVQVIGNFVSRRIVPNPLEFDPEELGIDI